MKEIASDNCEAGGDRAATRTTVRFRIRPYGEPRSHRLAGIQSGGGDHQELLIDSKVKEG